MRRGPRFRNGRHMQPRIRIRCRHRVQKKYPRRAVSTPRKADNLARSFLANFTPASRRPADEPRAWIIPCLDTRRISRGQRRQMLRLAPRCRRSRRACRALQRGRRGRTRRARHRGFAKIAVRAFPRHDPPRSRRACDSTHRGREHPRTLEDARAVVRAGHAEPEDHRKYGCRATAELISELSKEFGAQAVVLAIDAKRDDANRHWPR